MPAAGKCHQNSCQQSWVLLSQHLPAFPRLVLQPQALKVLCLFYTVTVCDFPALKSYSSEVHISFAFLQLFEQDFLVVCLYLHTSLWFACAPNVTQTLRQKRRGRLWGEIPVSAAGQGWACTLSRGQTQPWCCWLRKGDGECLRVLVSGLKSALSSFIPLPQFPGSVAVQLCFSTGADGTVQEGIPCYQLCAPLCAPSSVCCSQSSTQEFCWKEAPEGFPGRSQVCVLSQASTKLQLSSGICVPEVSIQI